MNVASRAPTYDATPLDVLVHFAGAGREEQALTDRCLLGSGWPRLVDAKNGWLDHYGCDAV